MIALAAMWAYDLNLYTIAYFDPGSAQGLFDWRGLALALAAPLFAIGGTQGRAVADPAVAGGHLPEPLAACDHCLCRRDGGAGHRSCADQGVDWTRAVLIACSRR